MARTIFEIIPLDPRVTEALALETAAIKQRKRIVAQVQAECPHKDIARAEGYSDSLGWVQTRAVCLRCGIHSDVEGKHDLIYRDAFSASRQEVVARSKWPDR